VNVQNNPPGAGEECPAAYDRVPGRQGLLSKRRVKLSQRLTHTRLCSLQLGGRGLAARLPGARFADALAGPDVSYLKRGYGWDRTRLDGRQGAAIWCGHGVFAHNLIKISALCT
jgi:hypothetical protein